MHQYDLADVVTLASFATVIAVLLVGHNVADHVLGQTDKQAANKGAPSAEQVADGTSRNAGWPANLAHVGQYHLVIAVLLGAAWLVLPLDLSPAGVAVGLAWSAVTHAFLDRRWPVRRLLRLTGSPNFAELRGFGMNGMYLADQSLHHLALLIAAGMIVLL